MISVFPHDIIREFPPDYNWQYNFQQSCLDRAKAEKYNDFKPLSRELYIFSIFIEGISLLM